MLGEINMKRCLRCNRTYWNDEFAFCLDDGTLLSAPYDPQKTLVLPSPNNTDLPPTEVSARNVTLDSVRTDKETVVTKSTSKRKRWNEESFFDNVEKTLKPVESARIRGLYKFSIDYADRVTWGTGSQRGTFNVGFNSLSPSKSLYTVFSNGNLDLNFAWLAGNEKANVIIQRFAQELGKLKGFNIPDDFGKKFISLYKDDWLPHSKDFIQAVLEVIPSTNDSNDQERER
jgi:hypothetical protein